MKKLLLLFFLGGVIFVSVIELKNNIEKIRMEYGENQRKEAKFTQHKVPDDGNVKNDNKKSIDLLGREMESMKEEKEDDYWRVIEREESYNNELQYYSKDNVVIIGDTIEITSRKETKGNKEYTSGLVESKDAYKYGYFEFIIQVGEGRGIFPAIWLLPINGEALPEIDIFEMIGSEPQIFYGVIHFKEGGRQQADYFEYEVPEKEQYSVALKWTEEALLWFVDQKEVYTTSKGVPKEYMYIILNQAIGGDWPGNPDDTTIFPNQFKILSYKIEPVFTKGRD